MREVNIEELRSDLEAAVQEVLDKHTGVYRVDPDVTPEQWLEAVDQAMSEAGLETPAD